MILDNEQQRELLMAAIKSATWPGTMVKEAVALLEQVEQAPVAQKP
jgi:hypothetical protein